MSGGGGKGGSETTETTIPDWIKQPAIRNLQRAEDVQRIEYMPYYGADVAAFTPTQNAAFQNNIGTAEAFGLLAPGHGLTATSGMPTPTDYDGFTGYSSQPMYESALAELKAKQPGAVAQYDALFGANVPTQRNYGGGGGGGFRGGANVPTHNPTRPNDWNPTMGVSQAVYEKAMDDTYRKVKVGEGQFGEGSYGYTGHGQQSRAGINAPGYVQTAPSGVSPTYYPSTSAFSSQDTTFKPEWGGTSKNYLRGKRVTGGR